MATTITGTSVRIEYCTAWGYLSRAARLAENILHDYHEQLPGGVTLVPGGGGVFEVDLGDRTLFSKGRAGRFPEENEVEDALGALLEAR